MKNIRVFYLKNFSFLEVKFSIYLNRRVFVMVAAHSHLWHIWFITSQRDLLHTSFAAFVVLRVSWDLPSVTTTAIRATPCLLPASSVNMCCTAKSIASAVFVVLPRPCSIALTAWSNSNSLILSFRSNFFQTWCPNVNSPTLVCVAPGPMSNFCTSFWTNPSCLVKFGGQILFEESRMKTTSAGALQ